MRSRRSLQHQHHSLHSNPSAHQFDKRTIALLNRIASKRQSSSSNTSSFTSIAASSSSSSSASLSHGSSSASPLLAQSNVNHAGLPHQHRLPLHHSGVTSRNGGRGSSNLRGEFMYKVSSPWPTATLNSIFDGLLSWQQFQVFVFRTSFTRLAPSLSEPASIGGVRCIGLTNILHPPNLLVHSSCNGFFLFLLIKPPQKITANYGLRGRLSSGGGPQHATRPRSAHSALLSHGYAYNASNKIYLH